MKIVTYNVNGLRAAITKGFLSWLKAINADIICLQEIKCDESQIDTNLIKELGYPFLYFHSAQKKGYSGVAIFSKIKPKDVIVGCEIEKYDQEGRIIRCDFETFSIMNVYMPSGSSGDHRQKFKFEWMEDYFEYIQILKKKINNLIICGDFNICHENIDIHNPKANSKSSGFLLEERAWVSKLFANDFIDTFRHFNKEPHQYTWWTFRAGARSKNLGWRIDYIIATESIIKLAKNTLILPDAVHSDHCPVLFDFGSE